MTESMTELNLRGVLNEHRIVLCGGSGGVGKTTTAAALGLLGAKLERRTLVVTIDPARRLANAMGLERLSSSPQSVSGVDGLDAMMLDPGATIDELVVRHARTPEGALRLLANPYYQQVASTLSGSREFMAMEKLYELASDTAYDLIVVDTPPTQHALDFFEAPRHLLELLDGSGLGVLIRSSNLMNRLSFGMLHRSQKQMASLFELLTGHRLMVDVTAFFHTYAGVIDGFKSRARKIQEVLESEATTFLLVVTAEEDLVDQADGYTSALDDRGMNLAGIIINQTLAVGALGDQRGLKAEATKHGVSSELLGRALQCHERWYGQACRQREIIEGWQASRAVPVAEVPRLSRNVSGFDDLDRFAGLLEGTSTVGERAKME